MTWFKRNRSPVPLAEKIRLTELYIQQQKEEGSTLRNELDLAKENCLRGKVILEELTQSASRYEDIILQLERKILENKSFLIEKLKEETGLTKQISEITRQDEIHTNFSITSVGGMSLQELLDANEAVCFSDLKGNTWEIARLP